MLCEHSFRCRLAPHVLLRTGTIAIEACGQELTVAWRVALAVLDRLRSQFLLAAVMGAIPAVVLTQGGSAMAICFNTVGESYRCSHRAPSWGSDVF